MQFIKENFDIPAFKLSQPVGLNIYTAAIFPLRAKRNTQHDLAELVFIMHLLAKHLIHFLIPL